MVGWLAAAQPAAGWFCVCAGWQCEWFAADSLGWVAVWFSVAGLCGGWLADNQRLSRDSSCHPGLEDCSEIVDGDRRNWVLLGIPNLSWCSEKTFLHLLYRLCRQSTRHSRPNDLHLSVFLKQVVPAGNAGTGGGVAASWALLLFWLLQGLSNLPSQFSTNSRWWIQAGLSKNCFQGFLPRISLLTWIAAWRRRAGASFSALGIFVLLLFLLVLQVPLRPFFFFFLFLFLLSLFLLLFFLSRRLPRCLPSFAFPAWSVAFPLLAEDLELRLRQSLGSSSKALLGFGQPSLLGGRWLVLWLGWLGLWLASYGRWLPGG